MTKKRKQLRHQLYDNGSCRTTPIKKQKDWKLHVLMCLIGGFAGTYSILRCHDNFGAAQTANLIFALSSLFGANIKQFLLRLLGLVFYMAGIETYVILSHKTKWNTQKWVVITQIACLVIIGLLPGETNLFICLYPIFYMLSAQWSVFHGACGYTASTIFSSNNVKQFSLAIGAYFFDRKAEQAEKARFFGFTLLYYHAGAAASLLCYHVMAQVSIWLCLIPVLAAAWMVYSPGKREKHSEHYSGFSFGGLYKHKLPV